MALAVAVSTSVNNQRGKTQIQVTGGTASTDYSLTVAMPGGSKYTATITTDGSGNWSKDFPVHERGTFTVTVTPLGAGPATTTYTGV